MNVPLRTTKGFENMTNKYTITKMKFEHHLLEGSHHDIGKQQGEIVKKNKQAMKMYTSGKFKPDKSKFDSFQELYDFYESFCPGLSDEAQGFAEELDVDIEQLFFYDYPISIQTNCSQFVVLPKITKNKHMLAGRSYEWNFDDEDLQLRTTQVAGKYRHIGFSGMMYGRYDGINDQGLCVTNSASGAWSAPIENKGLNWALAVRVLLDNCKNVEEATKTLMKIPVNVPTTFILSDKTGKAALLECMDGHYEKLTIDEESDEQHLIETNHYRLPNNLEYNKYNNPWLLPNSKTRYATIEKALESKEGLVSSETIQEILSQEFPEGLCCHWYSDGFGTLWSMNFDVTEGKIRICFGPPTHNEWYEFHLDATIVKHEYIVTFPNKPIGG